MRVLYNSETHERKKQLDCITCEYFDKVEKRCKGVGKKCFEYDEITLTAYDPLTHLPINLEKGGVEHAIEPECE